MVSWLNISKSVDKIMRYLKWGQSDIQVIQSHIIKSQFLKSDFVCTDENNVL